MNKIALALIAAAIPMTAATAMPVSTVIAKADALKKKGAMAMFSSDLGLLKKELSTAGKQLGAERRAAITAGRKPAYCPPTKGSFDSDELLAYLHTIPPAQRGMSLKTAYKGFLAKKFPCPA